VRILGQVAVYFKIVDFLQTRSGRVNWVRMGIQKQLKNIKRATGYGARDQGGRRVNSCSRIKN